MTTVQSIGMLAIALILLGIEMTLGLIVDELRKLNQIFRERSE